MAAISLLPVRIRLHGATSHSLIPRFIHTMLTLPLPGVRTCLAAAAGSLVCAVAGTADFVIRLDTPDSPLHSCVRVECSQCGKLTKRLFSMNPKLRACVTFLNHGRFLSFSHFNAKWLPEALSLKFKTQ